MFFTNDPHYAMNYMATGYNKREDSWCVVTTVDRFNLKVFDFMDELHIKKL